VLPCPAFLTLANKNYAEGIQSRNALIYGKKGVPCPAEGDEIPRDKNLCRYSIPSEFCHARSREETESGGGKKFHEKLTLSQSGLNYYRLLPHENRHVCKKEIAFIEAVGASRLGGMPLHTPGPRLAGNPLFTRIAAEKAWTRLPPPFKKEIGGISEVPCS
jgi:hypothetical protein